MKIITQDYVSDKMLDDTIKGFSKKFGLFSILKTCNAYKTKGFSTLSVFLYMLKLAFDNRSMYMSHLTGTYAEEFGKDTVYRLLNNASINWMKFTMTLATIVTSKSIVPLTSEERGNVLIIDDTLFERPRAKKVELLSRVYDHVTHKYKKGFRLLTLGWSDGNTFVPVAGRLMSSAKDSNVYTFMQEGLDKRTLAYRRRVQSRSKATTVMIDLLAEAKKSGIQAKHVLFDTWFCSPASIIAVKNIGFECIAMAKKSQKMYYSFQGKRQSVKDIYTASKKRRGRSKYLLSAEVMVEKDDNAIPARLVFVRNRNKSKDWLVLISTDMTLTEDEIIQMYGKRWSIEVFFKVCKSYLKLAKECRSISYDALTAHVAIVFTRYMVLSLKHRENSDNRSIGELYMMTCDEMQDITYHEALFIIINTLINVIQDKLSLAAKQLDQLIQIFIESLPIHIKNRLIP